MPRDIPRLVLTEVALSDDGVCTHDLFTNIGGEETIPRKKLYSVLKTMAKTETLVKKSGTDSRGLLAFKWVLP